MDIKEYTLGGSRISLQVSTLKNVPEGNFEPGMYFLLKNITEDNISIEVLPANSTEYISTVLYPGWNPELIKGVKNVVSNTLQYGY